jgi:hypothetical protein
MAAREKCYQCVTNALAALARHSVMCGGRALTAAECEEDTKRLLAVAMKSRDTLFLEHLYKAMLELGLESELLDHGSNALEAYLSKAGGLSQPNDLPVSAHQVLSVP